jgi:DNA polymerase elongation subunit (family B)
MTTTTKKSIGKHFRLIDFYTFDKIGTDEEDDSSSGSEKPKTQDKQFLIQMFGLSEQGETASITIINFQPFFYIKVGDQWDQGNANGLLDYIKSKVRYLSNDILSIELIDQYKLYGFTGGKKSRFVKINFQTYQAFQKVKNLWYKYDETTNQRVSQPFKYEQQTLILYESTIPPILRYFHIKNISPSGWILLNTSKCKPIIESLKETTCKYEYLCLSKWINAATEKETRVPYKICSFDIEASSSHGDFPIPIKSYKRLATNIVDCFQIQSKLITDPSRQKMLVKKMILTAFGYSAFDGIDSVYPIDKTISKERIEILSKQLLEKTISVTDDLLNDESTIESLFEKMKESTATVQEGDNDESENEDEAEDVVTRPTYNKKKTRIIELTIIDIFNSDQYNREQKITILNNLFSKPSNDESAFPKLEGDKVTFIGSTFMRYGEKEPYLNHCLVLNTCDPVENAEIETVTEEKDLLLQWTALIKRENPDFIIGYNIFGFDYEFMFRRAQENGCVCEFLELSRLKDNNISENPALENTKIQIASGEYDLRYPKMTGRLQIDMYSYFRRDFNLSSYKLDDVAGQFISDRIHKVELDDSTGTTRLYSKNLAGLHKGDYIHIQISNFSSDFYRGGEKLYVVDILMDQIVKETVKGKEVDSKYNIIVIRGIHDLAGISGSLEWTMAKDDVSPQDIFRLANGSSADRAIVAKYCIQDCNLVHHLMNKIDVLTGYIEMSSICSVPISYLVFRGQGIKLTSYVAKKCREKGTLMPDLEKKSGGDGYEGAIVLPPKCSMYIDNPVACVDYSSLYPSSMISQNYSHDSKVWSKEYDLQGNLIKETGERFLSGPRKGEYKYDNLSGYQYINIEFDTFKYLRLKGPKSKEVKTKVGKKICRWAQLPNNEKSIMPAILTELLDARANTRKKAKNEPDPFMQNILDKRQLGYKVTANSLYGQCGARTSTFFEQDVAASTTATGRMMITYAKRIIEEVYGDRVYDTACQGPVRCKAEYVYGDTDSVFFTFNLEHPETKEKIRGKPALEATIEIAQDAANLCTSYLKPPMALAYEKTLMPFLLLSKKRYVGMLYEEDPNKGKLKYMGLVLKRRDNCDLVKDIYGGVLDKLMKHTDIKPALNFLYDSLNDLIQGKVPIEKLTITKSLRSDYKNPQQIAHRVLADRISQRDPGNKPKPGDRIPYVFIVNPKASLQGEKIETPQFVLDNKLKLDYTYYITNQLMKPLQQLFGLAIEKIWQSQNMTTAIKTFHKDMGILEGECHNDLEIFMKKKEKYTTAKIKTLLFDKFLLKIHQEQNGIRTITDCFGRK